jgi:hypothetical protein
MAEQTPRLSWPYPSQNDDPWFDAFVSFTLAMDASGFASREDRHLIMGEGGVIDWDIGTDTLSWAGEIFLSSAMTGFSWRVPADSVTIQQGEVLYVNLARNPLTNVNLTPAVASTIPNTDDALALAIRFGNTILWRTGLRMLGGSAPSLSPVSVTSASFSLAHNGSRTTADPVELIVGGGLFDGGIGIPNQVEFNLVGFFVATGAVGNCRLRLYDVGTPSTPAAPVLRSTLTIPFASAGGTVSFSNALSIVSSITGVDQILDSQRVYEVTAELDGADGLNDIFNVWRGSLEVT